MATIQIDGKHRLSSDARQWSLQVKRKVRGEDNWSPIRHYSTLESAAKGCYTYFVNTSDADGAIEIMEESKAILVKLTSALTPEMKI